jgi:2-polyprenyl-3-methyl-5-hydroxy-6-metoxy-1,4-benzoquinol methylase
MKLDEYSKKCIHYYSEKVPVFIENILQNNDVDTLVDLGCGDGALLYAIFRKGYLNKINSVIAIDISEGRLRNAKKIDRRILGIVADVSDCGAFKNIKADFVISSQVIEHLRDDGEFIHKVSSILDSGGLFYLSTVFKKSFAWYFYRSSCGWALDPTHLREYTDMNQLLDIVKRYNFGILENKRTLQWFPITDFILKRIGMKRNIYHNKVMRFFRNIKVPILGYYNWELVLKRL